jgi:hypothetical protein
MGVGRARASTSHIEAAARKIASDLNKRAGSRDHFNDVELISLRSLQRHCQREWRLSITVSLWCGRRAQKCRDQPAKTVKQLQATQRATGDKKPVKRQLPLSCSAVAIGWSQCIDRLIRPGFVPVPAQG